MSDLVILAIAFVIPPVCARITVNPSTSKPVSPLPDVYSELPLDCENICFSDTPRRYAPANPNLMRRSNVRWPALPTAISYNTILRAQTNITRLLHTQRNLMTHPQVRGKVRERERARVFAMVGIRCRRDAPSSNDLCKRRAYLLGRGSRRGGENLVNPSHSLGRSRSKAK